jgi:hypothetical protein
MGTRLGDNKNRHQASLWVLTLSKMCECGLTQREGTTREPGEPRGTEGWFPTWGPLS